MNINPTFTGNLIRLGDNKAVDADRIVDVTMSSSDDGEGNQEFGLTYVGADGTKQKASMSGSNINQVINTINGRKSGLFVTSRKEGLDVKA